MEPKFNLNRPKVSDEEINKHKDFDKLVKQFKEQSIQKARSDVNFLKNKKITYASVIAGVTVICTLTYFTVFKKQNSTTNDKITTSAAPQTNKKPDTENKNFIFPPNKKLNVPYSSYKINSLKGGELSHSGGSKIKIPKTAFVNKQGQEIVGEIEIQYREFHNQADIIASGIPMTYDSAGTQYHFESAGMFDIRGYQNGEPIFIKPDKNISIEMASQYPGNHYNQYELDTLAKNWNYLKKDETVANSDKSINVNKEPVAESKLTKELQVKIDAIPPKIEKEKIIYNTKLNRLPKTESPPKPLKANGGRPQFELDVDYKEFPELLAFKNAVFEVGEENSNYKKELSQITWNEAKISEGPQKGTNYLLTLKQKNRTEKLIVYPVLSGVDYDKAVKLYEKKFAEYKTDLAKREETEKKLKEEMEVKQRAYIEEQKKLSADLLKEQIRIRKQMEEQLASQFKTMGTQQQVTRLFQVNRFGIYNSDCPNSLPTGDEFHPIFISGEKSNPSVITPVTVYLIEHNKNIVYSFSNKNYGTMRYNPDNEYSLCIVTQGRLYLYSKQEFKQTVSNNSNKFYLTPLPESIDDASGFKKALGI